MKLKIAQVSPLFESVPKLCFHKPQLPPYLQQLKISGLAVGREQIALEIFRYGDDLGVHVVEKPAAWEIIMTR